MIGMIRLVVFGLLFLTVVYVALSLYSRSVRREKLEREWDEEIREGDRDAFIRKGLEEYRHSLRRKLIWLVFIVPIVVVAALIYVVNFM